MRIDDMHRKSIFKMVMIRVLFYGLFLLGPYILTESHIIHVRMKKESSMIADDSSRMELTKKYERWICVLDATGMACFCLWTVWLLCATGHKIAKLVKENHFKER